MSDNMKAQITIVSVLVLVVTLIVIAALFPLINTSINLILNETTGDTAAQLGIRALPVILVIAVILSVLGYGHFQRERQYY